MRSLTMTLAMHGGSVGADAFDRLVIDWYVSSMWKRRPWRGDICSRLVSHDTKLSDYPCRIGVIPWCRLQWQYSRPLVFDPKSHVERFI